MAGAKLNGISEAYQSVLYPIIEGGGASICEVTLKLHMGADEPNPYSCQITSMRIVQDPEANYADKFQLDITTTAEIYSKIRSSSNTLRATLTFVYVKDQIRSSPIVKKYFVLIAGTSNNTTVPLTTTNDTTSIQELMMQVTLELHDKAVITARAKTISGVLRSVTLERALNALVSHFEIDQRVIISPDNKNVYPQIEFPAGNDMSSIFNYLQKKYGVYTGGIANYLTGDVFYIYPPYVRSDSQSGNRINIYTVRPNTLIGATTYYRQNKNTIDIIAAGDITTNDTQIQDTSNNGSHSMMVLGGDIMDNFVTPLANGLMKTNAASFISIANKKAKSLIPSVNLQSVFKASTDNAFTSMSKYAKQSNQTISVTWYGAYPFLVRPGASVNFVYEKDIGTHKQIKKTKGVLLGIAYDSDYAANTMAANGRYFQFKATLVLKVEEL